MGKRGRNQHTEAKQATTPSGPRKGIERSRKAKQTAFLKAYRESGTLSGAARSTNVSRSSHRRWLQQDPEYVGKFGDVNEEATDALEQEARRRALEGVEEPVFYKGERVGSIRKFSDQLLMLLLMAKRPNQFRERVDVTSKVDHGLRNRPGDHEDPVG